MRNFFTDNVNSILGAISLHLLVVIAFLGFKLGEMDEIQKEQILIEINEEVFTPDEDKKPEELTSEELGEGMPELDNQTLHNIASNVAGKLDPKISTSEYEKQVLQELGIKSLESPGGNMEKQAERASDENAIEPKPEETKSTKDSEVSNVLRKDNTTVSYFLEGRWHRYIYIPTYKCQGGGSVIMDLVINPSGKVLSAVIQENKSTQDPCLREEAYRSAITAQFNSDSKAPAKQLGSIAFVFLAQ